MEGNTKEIGNYLLVKEVARILRLSEYSVRKYVKSGKLRGIKPKGSRKMLITETSLKELLSDT